MVPEAALRYSIARIIADWLLVYSYEAAWECLLA
jgi:hypothetical protein